MPPEGLVVVVSFLFFGGIAAGIVWLTVWNGRRELRNLAAIASRQGLDVLEKRFVNLLTGAELHGQVHGRATRLYKYTTGSGKSQKTWAAAGVRPRDDGGLTFRLSRQGALTRVMEFFGSREITVGDPEFDSAWFVQTNQPEFLAAALVPDIRRKLLDAHRARGSGGFKLEDGEVVYSEQGGFSNAGQAARIEATLPVLNELADVAEAFASMRA